MTARSALSLGLVVGSPDKECCAFARIRIAIVLPTKMLQRFVTVFDHDNGRINHGANRDRNTSKDMMFEVCPSKLRNKG